MDRIGFGLCFFLFEVVVVVVVVVVVWCGGVEVYSGMG